MLHAILVNSNNNCKLTGYQDISSSVIFLRIISASCNTCDFCVIFIDLCSCNESRLSEINSS